MKVYLNEEIHNGAKKKLSNHVDIVNNFNECLDMDGIIVRTEKINRELMEKCSKLKVIGKHGIGYDNIDIEAAKDLGIVVVYTPSANSQSVAELIVALMSNIARNISLSFQKIKLNEIVSPAPPDMIGFEMRNKTVGLIGMGNIALIVSKILKNGYGMNVIGFDRYKNLSEEEELNITQVESLEEVLLQSDFISVSVPLTLETANMISKSEFSIMKKNAILINSSRGGIVNEEALYEALDKKGIWGAASDVFVSEPPTSENPLVHLENFVATPHIGACTEEAMGRMGYDVVNDVLNVLNGTQPVNRVI